MRSWLPLAIRVATTIVLTAVARTSIITQSGRIAFDGEMS